MRENNTKLKKAKKLRSHGYFESMSSDWLEDLCQQQISDDEKIYKILMKSQNELLLGPCDDDKDYYEIANKCPFGHMFIPFDCAMCFFNFINIVFEKLYRFFFVLYSRMFTHKQKCISGRNKIRNIFFNSY